MAEQSSKVSGIVQIDGSPARRTVRAFGYEATVHAVDGEIINLSKSLGHATSDPDTGEYTIDLLDGYDKRIFVVAFDDYGSDFQPNLAVTVGDRVHPTTPNGHIWECTGSGTLPSEEPSWVIDTETAQLYGTASMIARPFYRPMVHGPVAPEVTIVESNFPSDNLLTYWAFDDGSGTTVADSHGTNDGILEGSPQWITDSALGSHAVDFKTGTAARMRTGINVDGSMDWTMSCWARKDETSDNRILLSAARDNQNYFYLIHRSDKNGLCIQYERTAHSQAQYRNTNTALSSDKYHHVVWVKQGASHKIYIDGVLKLDGNIDIGTDFGLDTTPEELIVGNRNSAFSSLAWPGPIDEFAFYDAAVEESTVLTLYNNGTPLSGPS